jgi:hypothetical protein
MDTPEDNPVAAFRKQHHALEALFRQREEALTKSAGGHALEYVLHPEKGAEQEQAVQQKACLTGLEMARERFNSEVRYFEGTSIPDLLARCARTLSTLIETARQEAERAALKVVDLPETSPKYREERLAILRNMQKVAGMEEFRALSRQVFAADLQ